MVARLSPLYFANFSENPHDIKKNCSTNVVKSHFINLVYNIAGVDPGFLVGGGANMIFDKFSEKLHEIE